ncbi:MAG: alpha/beta hydrolase [Candidatus Omnitrophota bacterium]|jgi:pimeloyl-ACP methyl ester carboxylesterase
MEQGCVFTGNHGDFHYIDWGGTGPLAHFSHATGFCAGLYTPLIEPLRPYLQIFGLDDRGHGRTTALADPQNLTDWRVFAADLEEFLVYLGGPVIAIGHSRGAVSSMMVAARHPTVIRSLVLIEPVILSTYWNWILRIVKKTGLKQLIPIVRRAAKRRNIWPDKDSMLTAYQNRGSFRSWTPEFLKSYVASCTEVAANGTVKLCCDPEWESKCFAVCPHDVLEYVPRLTCPTLVLYGGNSDVFSASVAKRLKTIAPSIERRCIAEASHFLPMERPRECAEAILAFLKDRNII